MNLQMLNLGMTLSVVCFVVGYLYRKKDRTLHIIFNIGGVIFNLTTSIYLIMIKYFLGGIAAADIHPIFDRWTVNAHRAIAVFSFIVLLLMMYTGFTKKKEQHIKMHLVFIILYGLVYISGLFLFTTNAN